MKKSNCLFIFLLLIIACSPTNNINITNIQDLASYNENSIIYSLPRSRLVLSVIAVRHYTVPGPYSNYAEKYLGIIHAPTISRTEWELNKVTLKAVEQPDPDYYFSVQTDNPAEVFHDFLTYTGEGMILQLDDHKPFVHSDVVTEDEPEPIHFTNLSVKRNLIETRDNSASTQTQIPVDMPVTKVKQGTKTVEEKAEEAANFILKIRKRRFKLLAGQYEVFPEGVALETSIKELNKLETEYLSLFVGRCYSDTITRNFYYVPQINKELERHVFCRFSDETGFHDAMGAIGKPLVLELRNLNFNQVLDNLHFPFSGPTYENILFYRIPDIASVRVFYSSNTILEAELKIFQYGSVVPWSVSGR